MSDYSFEFTGVEKVNAWGVTVRQIRAIRDIPRAGVTAGDIGGWIESAELTNGTARVSGDAWVFGDAQVFGNAWVYGNAWVSGNARVSGDARVYGDARVSGNAWVYGDAWVYGNAWVSGDARVSGDAWVSGDAQVSGNARVSGDARVYGDAWVSGDARVELTRDYIAVGPIGSEGVTATLVRTKDGHLLNVGCWTGTLETLPDEVAKRRKSWGGATADHDVWQAQYDALTALGRATAQRWEVGSR